MGKNKKHSDKDFTVAKTLHSLTVLDCSGLKCLMVFWVRTGKQWGLLSTALTSSSHLSYSL